MHSAGCHECLFFLSPFFWVCQILIATAVGNILNIIQNGVFIAMGHEVRGVSLVTILSRILILVLMMLFSGKVRL